MNRSWQPRSIKFVDPLALFSGGGCHSVLCSLQSNSVVLQIVEDLRKLSACWGRGIAGKDDGEMCIESEGMSSHVFVQIGSYRKVLVGLQ